MSTGNSRPVAITVICIIGFLGAIMGLPLIFSPVAYSIGTWYPALLALASINGFVSFIGMWMMKKWGVYLYTGITVVGQVMFLAKGVWHPLSLIIPLIVIIIGFSNLKRMS